MAYAPEVALCCPEGAASEPKGGDVDDWDLSFGIFLRGDPLLDRESVRQRYTLISGGTSATETRREAGITVWPMVEEGKVTRSGAPQAAPTRIPTKECA